MTTLRQLRYFTAAAQTGSATAAAAMLNVSQPSVSAAIRDLEATLGQPLFLRQQARGLELTPFGTAKVREARDILARMETMLETGAGAGHRRLVLGYFATLGPTWVPDMALHLGRALPDTAVELRECDLEAIARFLANGVIDCALGYDIGLPAGMHRIVLTEVTPHALLPPGHPLAAQDSVSLAELAECDYILIDLPLSRETLLVPFWQRGLSPRTRLKTASIEMARGMVAAGLGVSLLYTRPGAELSAGAQRVVFKPLRDDLPGHRLVFAHDAARRDDPAVAAAARAVGQHFGVAPVS